MQVRTPACSRLLWSLAARPTWLDTIASNQAPQTGHSVANSLCRATLHWSQRLFRRSTTIVAFSTRAFFTLALLRWKFWQQSATPESCRGLAFRHQQLRPVVTSSSLKVTKGSERLIRSRPAEAIVNRPCQPCHRIL